MKTPPPEPGGPSPEPRSALDPDFFDDAYYRLIAAFHPEAETRHEVAALRDILGLAQDDRILDLGCGWGRHLALLWAAGHDVVGVDLSYALLRRVIDMGDVGDVGDWGRVVGGDMLWLPLRDGVFDVVINVATSLGLFLDDRDALTAVTEARRVLRPGGRLLIEGMHREDVEARYAERDRWTLDDGTEVRARRRFDPVRGVSHEVLRWSGPAGAGAKRHSLRLRSAAELVALVETAGLALDAIYGGWEMEPFEPDSERVILVGRT